MEEDKVVSERQDSIEIDQNAKKEYSFHVKCYYDSETAHPDKIIARIEMIYNELHKKFK